MISFIFTDPPVVSVSPLNITVNESANPFLGCSYVANPQELQKVIWWVDTTEKASLDVQKFYIWKKELSRRIISVFVFRSKDDKNLSLSDQRYEGGTLRNPPLRIKNVSREDMGYYNCWLQNSVNMIKSESSIFLNVMCKLISNWRGLSLIDFFIDPPVVNVLMEPNVVKAVKKLTVILVCNVSTGNPSNLQKVSKIFF